MFCLKEPGPLCGGETVLLKNQDLTAILDPEVTRKFEQKKIRYQSFLPNKNTGAGLQKGWQDRFWMDDSKVCVNWFYFFLAIYLFLKKLNASLNFLNLF